MILNITLNARILTMMCMVLVSLSSCTSNTSKVEEKNTSASAANEHKEKDVKKNILFFGTSLTAGYGLDAAQAFPALIQKKIDAAGLPYKVINAGLSGETSAAGKSRIDWALEQPVSVMLLELGANDGLRGLPLDETTKNLQDIIDKVKAKYPDVTMLLAGMQIPPNMGTQYSVQFKEIFPALAAKNKMTLIPFLLQGVGGVPELNQEDGIHPTAEGQKILAENVWKELKPLL